MRIRLLKDNAHLYQEEVQRLSFLRFQVWLQAVMLPILLRLRKYLQGYPMS
jgi:hypothetical protein